MMTKENKNLQKGVSLIITFFIMIIVLSVVLSVSILLYSQLKILRNIGNSVVAFYAADSGIEKVLYYDWQVKNGDTRGLCSMLDPTKTDYCKESGSGDSSIYCGSPTPSTFIGGCAPNVCNDCTVTFKTILSNRASYSVSASVSVSEEFGPSVDFNAIGKGEFGGTTRQINTPIYATE